ncbi:MAG: ATP-binding cassette domain-containing protein [Candidatus Obscuribacterales bacterium]|nr:ATP-binding cassette domain-containing protein [Candidatus Obscuribacterales bacterium]
MHVDQMLRLLYPPGTTERPTQKTSPYQRLGQMIFEDRQDLILIIIYTFFTGLLTLSVPLATQIIVNTIAAGVFLQPLTVLAGGVLAALTFVALLRLLTLWMVEQIRQRTFSRVALRLAYRVPRIKHPTLTDEYLPELVNRFFDTITVQSAWFSFLLDAPAAALQVIVGMTLLAIYSPWLLAFDLIVIAFFLLEVFVLGFGGFRTRSEETTQRFLIAEWLEELARCESGIKTNGIPAFLLKHTDNLLVDYVKRRRVHFKVLFRQAAGLYFFQALSSAGVLGIGAFLVVHRQLTMGQLVASLLIVNMVVPGLERLIRNLQNIYELLSALGKIGYVEDLPLERRGGEAIVKSGKGAEVNIKSLRFAYPGGAQVIRGLTMNLTAGERISLFGHNATGKTTLAKILCGLVEPGEGIAQINGVDVRDADLDSLRRTVALVSDNNEIFPGSIIDNISLGRPEITYNDVTWALNMVRFDEFSHLPHGLQTEVGSAGKSLSRGQIQKLLLARAIVKRPDLLIFDEAFTAIEEKSKLEILDNFYAPEQKWTIIDISHDADSITRSDRIFLIDNGVIVESGTPAELIRLVDGKLEELFPQLVRILRIVEKNQSR